MSPPELDRRVLDEVVRRGLEEDVGIGDVTTLATVPADLAAEGWLVSKERGVFAGRAAAERVLAHLDESVEFAWEVADGEQVASRTRLGILRGPARAILTGERLALNLLQRLSGIATATHRMVEAARPAGVLDTRKNAPGLRALDKWAVRVGGGTNHRTGLFDRFLIKDNHIAACGGIREAIGVARGYRRQHAPELLLEVEARTLDEVEAVLESDGVDWVLLDNMVRVNDDGRVDVSLLRDAVQRIGGRLTTEASGNITLETVAAVAATGVDYVSAGALTHSVKALDISLQVRLA
jgi:nicotinate-nucleotide pyrophosphorylase (carboxylating)